MNPIDRAIVLEEAKKYTDSQRLAHIETKSIICGKTFYGADRIDFSAIQGVPEFMFVKISDKILTPDDFKSIVFYQKTVDNHGGVAEGQRDILSEMTFTEPVEFDGVTSAEGYLGGTDGTLYVIILHTDDPGVNDGKPHTAGTYVLRLKTENAEVYCVSVTTETIHPIDQKFIPAETPDAEILESYQTFTKHYVAAGEAPDNVQWKEYYDPVMVFIDTEIPADGTHVSLSGLDVAKLEQMQTIPVPICFTMDNGYSRTVMPVFTVVLANGLMFYSCQYALTSLVIFQRNTNGTWEAYKQ